MAQYDYEIGTTYGGMVNVEAFTSLPKAPKGMMQDYSQYIPLANALTRGSGWPVATWHWGFLSMAQRNELKTYCTAASAAVFIKTRKPNDAFEVYTATMEWPEEEQSQAGRVQDFTITFKNLIVYTP